MTWTDYFRFFALGFGFGSFCAVGALGVRFALKAIQHYNKAAIKVAGLD